MSKSEKSRGSFFGALVFFLFFLLLLIGAAAVGVYTIRDRLLIEYIREKGPRHFGVEVLAIDSLLTRPVGSLSLELKGVIFQASSQSPVVRAQQISISTPKTLLGLYQLFHSKETLTLKMQLLAPQIQATSKTETAVSQTDSTAQNTNPPKLPFPISIEAELRDGQIDLGTTAKPISIKGLTGIVRSDITPTSKADTLAIRSTGQLVLKLGIADRTDLPMRADWTLQAKPTLASNGAVVPIEISNLSVSALGMTIKSQGKIDWPSQAIDFNASGFSTDLSVIPIDKGESEALGIVGRLKGQAEIAVKVVGFLNKSVKTSGLFKLKNATLPFELVRKTPKPFLIKGPVDVDLDVPFAVDYNFASQSLEGIDLQLATFRFDMTNAEVRADGILKKNAAIMMGLQGQLTAAGKTLDITFVEFRLANLLFATKGQISIDPSRLSKLDVRVSLPNLQGWPQLVPMLGTIDPGPVINAAQINQANGSMTLAATIELPIADPSRLKSDTKIELDALDARDIVFPFSFKKDADTPNRKLAEGILRAAVQASGSFSSTSWKIRRAVGTVDLKDVKIEWGDLLNKARGRDLIARFDSAADGAKIKIDKLDIKTGISSLSGKGTVFLNETEKAPEYKVATSFESQLVLSQLYDLVPVLRSVRSKVPSGTIFNSYKVTGVFNGDVAKSPLVLAGRTVLRTPQFIYLDQKSSKSESDDSTAASKEKDSTPKFVFLKWPVVKNSKIIFDAQIGSLKHKTGEIKSVTTVMSLDNGSLTGTAKIGQAFGGPVEIKAIRVPDLATTAVENISASAAGTFQEINLSNAVEYFDPEFKKLVGGTSSGSFTSNLKPFSSESILDTATASGTVAVKNGFLSSLKFDDLVNTKIAENPKVAQLLGAKPSLNTKGAAFDMVAKYAFSKGRLNLKDFKMDSPEKNSIDLEGWLQKDFQTELKGTAYIANTSIGGSFRQANSDKTGRLVVPIKISGSLKEPSLDIAEEVISAMVSKTVELETTKIKDKVKTEATKVIEEKKNEAVDKIKNELKRLGL
jgi:hypothetical protein